MKKEKKRVFKLLLWILLFIIVLVIAGYFLYTWLRLNDKGIPRDYFSEKTFITQDNQTRLSFDEGAENVTIRSPEGTIKYAVSDYTDNVFTFVHAKRTLYFIVIDNQTVYGGSGIYLFLIGE